MCGLVGKKKKTPNGENNDFSLYVIGTDQFHNEDIRCHTVDCEVDNDKGAIMVINS